jgi:hypothetical protein
MIKARAIAVVLLVARGPILRLTTPDEIWYLRYHVS